MGKVQGFDPLGIESLVGWWEGSDTTNFDIAYGRIQTWKDKSGTNNHFQQSNIANTPFFSRSEHGHRVIATFEPNSDNIYMFTDQTFSISEVSMLL